MQGFGKRNFMSFSIKFRVENGGIFVGRSNNNRKTQTALEQNTKTALLTRDTASVIMYSDSTYSHDS